MSGFVNHFDGAAGFYARHRPGYPQAVWDLLLREAPLDTSSSVLDLGCGPGTVALSLAGFVRSVIGVDSDPGMLAEATRAAETAGTVNVTWELTTAEGYAGPPAWYRLITIGSAFHWMDRPAVADKAYRLLEPGGLLAVLGTPTPLVQIRQREGVGRAIAEVQDRWFPDDQRLTTSAHLRRPEEVLRNSRFGEATVHCLPSVQDWNIGRLVGFLRSTSWRLDQHLGGRFSTFIAEVDTAIRSVEPSGEWKVRADVEVILARR